MSDRRVTLSDVAARAGVSRTTASFVLSGRQDMRISADAAARVMQAARELSYRPNLLARSLRTQLTLTVGLISDTVATEPFAGDLVRGGLAAALQAGHLLFVGESQGDTEVEAGLVQGMIDRGVSGFVYASMFTRETALPEILHDQTVVMMNCLPVGSAVSAVIPDEYEAGRSAVTTLLEAGHSDQIHLVGETPDHVVAARERRAGIDSRLAEAHLALAGTVDCLWWPASAREAVRRRLARRHSPQRIHLPERSHRTRCTYQALQAAGLSVPQDVSVISFDDSDVAAWLDPPLTSVALPHFEIGRRAVRLLLEPEADPLVHRIPMPVMTRDSVSAPRPFLTKSGRRRRNLTPVGTSHHCRNDDGYRIPRISCRRSYLDPLSTQLVGSRSGRGPPPVRGRLFGDPTID